MLTWDGETVPAGTTITPDACALPTNTVCDHFELTVDVPPEHWNTNTGGAEVGVMPEGDADFDLYVYDADTGEPVGDSANGGNTSERVFIDNASGTYRVEVTPYSVVDGTYTGGARVESRAEPAAGQIPTEPVSNLACADGKAGPFPAAGSTWPASCR